VRILYCPVWDGYDERAASLAAELNAETEHEAEVEAGGNGQFDVLAEGELVFSKQQAGRFPQHSEVRALLGWPHLSYLTLAEQRRACGLSQKELAELTGTTQSAIARLESGGRPPRIDTLLGIAEALDCELAVDLRPRTG
jgi:selT/selW/selH-like putative selenoprotein